MRYMFLTRTPPRETALNADLLRFTDGLAAAHGQFFGEASRYYDRGMMHRDDTLYPPWQSDSATVRSDVWR